jgi:hypothetical protein
MQPAVTVTGTSLDGALRPWAFFARTRTKIEIDGRFTTVTTVLGMPVSAERSVRPGPSPTSITYDVGASPPAAAFHCRTAVDPEMDAERFDGAIGASEAPL